MATSTLQAIITKVRRLTRSPSSAQITDAQITEYVNVSYQQDLPETLRLKSLRKTFTFYTQPNVAQYSTISSDDFPSSTDPMVDFKNKDIDLEKPIFVDGYPQFLSQNREQFYNLYPLVNNVERIGTGNGVTLAFAGTLTNKPVLPNNVMFTSIDANNSSIVLVDIPQTDATSGITLSIGDLVEPGTTTALGTIAYKTGVFNLTFPVAPESNFAVEAHTVPYVAGRPQSVLFYDNTFEFRPVPDKPYRVTMDMYIQPSDFLDSSGDPDTTKRPELDQMWQYIAYLAAKKIFEDRMDLESVQMIMPELKNQERLVLRRTIVQQTKERTATIYTDQLDRGGWYWWGQNF